MFSSLLAELIRATECDAGLSVPIDLIFQLWDLTVNVYRKADTIVQDSSMMPMKKLDIT